MTPQQIFDKVATHLLKQGKRALQSNGDCAYRGGDGTSCAIGCLIPDDRYDPYLEGKVLLSAGGYVAAALPFVPTAEAIEIMQNLQALHDGGGWGMFDVPGPDLWRECLLSLALAYDLSPAVLGVDP